MKHNKRIIFRCDAGGDFGLGHLIRSQAIAKTLVDDDGIPPCFLIHNAAYMSLALDRSIDWKPVPDPVGTKVDIDFVLAELQSKPGPATLVIDSKLADERYIGEIRTHTGVTVCCIQDENPLLGPADIILNNHIDAETWYKEPQPGQLRLLGPQFNTIHPTYFDSASISGRTRILVTLGGSDPQNHSLWVLEHLADLFSGYSVDLVIGPSHPAPHVVIERARYHANIEIALAPSSLAPYARRAFFAISAGGTTCYELLAAGVALAAIAVEPHQRLLIEAVNRHGAITDLGGPQLLDVAESRGRIMRLLDSPQVMQEQVRRGKLLFPCTGLPQITRELTKDTLR